MAQAERVVALRAAAPAEVPAGGAPQALPPAVAEAQPAE
jgi:hypothetical protein